MKKIIAGLGTAALLVIGVSPASAAIISNVNGASTASIIRIFGANFNIVTSNNANITNTVNSNTNTGGNHVSSTGSQSGTFIGTGAANSGSVTDSAANSTDISTTLETPATTDDTIDSVGGASVTQIATADQVDDKLQNTNAVTVNNAVAAGSTTGSNDVHSDGKLVDTQLQTGIGTALTGVTNTFNITMRTFTRRIR